MVYTIMAIEAAINYWRVVAPSPDGVFLTPHVRVLATVYGQMIAQRTGEVARSTLTPAQAWAVDTATACSIDGGRHHYRFLGREKGRAGMVTNPQRRPAGSVTKFDLRLVW